MPDPVEPAVSSEVVPPAPSGQSEAKPADPSPAPPPATPAPAAEPGKEPPPPKDPGKSGYDALPEHAKDIIKRQTEAKREALARAEAAEAELAALKNPPAPVDPEEEETLRQFKSLAQKAGYKTAEEWAAENAAKAKEAQDRQELAEVVKEFDGVNLPKVTEEDIGTYLRQIQNDPKLSYLFHAPFREIARKMREKEIQQMEVDRVLKSGGAPPPTPIEKGGSEKQPGSAGPQRFNTFHEMQSALARKRGAK